MEFLNGFVRAFGILLALSVTAHILSWRIGYWELFFSQRDLMPGISPEDVLVRLWDEYQVALVRGIAQDVLFSAVAGLILVLAGKWPRWITLIFITAFLAANLEHIKYNYSHIDFSMLGVAADGTFLSGSLSPSFVKYFAVMSIVLMVTRGLLRFILIQNTVKYAAPVIILGSLVFGPDLEAHAPDWAQTNPLLPSYSGSNLPTSFEKPDKTALLNPSSSATKMGSYNILLVYLEGLSLSSLQRGSMTMMSKLANEGVNFENYVSRQIITANGLYATLTADTPSFLNRFVRWEELKEHSKPARQSLAARLNEHGYHTTYLQAADLTFMSKDTRMEILGFSEIKGDESWAEAYSRNGWGIDDVALIEHTLSHIDNRPSEQPWFVTVLTSGTHSPYNVPNVASPERRDALQHADRAVAKLVSGLRSRNLLRNTVVILTSDEGRELTPGGGFLNDLTLNRLPLIVLHPDLQAMSISDYLMNTDLRNLALKLSAPLNESTLRGSLPRHSDLVFGNIITGKVFWYDPTRQTLIGCRLKGFACLKWSDRADLFGPRTTPDDAISLPAFEAVLKAHDQRTGIFKAELH